MRFELSAAQEVLNGILVDPSTLERTTVGDKLKLLIAMILPLAGCAAIYNPRTDPPDLVATTTANSPEVAGCLVQELDALAPFGDGYPHHALMRVPDRSYEVAITRTIVVGGEVYLMLVDGTAPGSRIELYSLWNWVDDVRPAIEACSETVVAERQSDDG